MPLNIDWKQILLHIFNFVLLFAILFFLLYNPIKKFMDKRVQYYKDMDEDTKRRSSEADEMKEAYEQKLAQVDEEIAAKRKEAEEQEEKRRAEVEERTAEEVRSILDTARADAEAEKRKIIDSAQTEIVGLVTEACQKAISTNPSDAMDGFLKQANEDKND